MVMMNFEFTRADMDLVVKLPAAVLDTQAGNRRTKGYVIV
jgi:hypothetical protein